MPPCIFGLIWLIDHYCAIPLYYLWSPVGRTLHFHENLQPYLWLCALWQNYCLRIALGCCLRRMCPPYKNYKAIYGSLCCRVISYECHWYVQTGLLLGPYLSRQPLKWPKLCPPHHCDGQVLNLLRDISTPYRLPIINIQMRRQFLWFTCCWISHHKMLLSMWLIAYLSLVSSFGVGLLLKLPLCCKAIISRSYLLIMDFTVVIYIILFINSSF